MAKYAMVSGDTIVSVVDVSGQGIPYGAAEGRQAYMVRDFKGALEDLIGMTVDQMKAYLTLVTPPVSGNENPAFAGLIDPAVPGVGRPVEEHLKPEQRIKEALRQESEDPESSDVLDSDANKIRMQDMKKAGDLPKAPRTADKTPVADRAFAEKTAAEKKAAMGATEPRKPARSDAAKTAEEKTAKARMSDEKAAEKRAKDKPASKKPFRW